MKHTPSLLRTGLQQAALLIGLGLSQGLAQTVTFTNTPTAVSNAYVGPITLQIGGLTNGETVVVQEFLDVNTNGVIDAGDWLVQQFKLTDGGASVIGGIVNSNVPGDITPTNSAITALMAFNNGNPLQTFAGKFLLKLSSPTGNFTSVTNTLTVTNLPYTQGFTGSVVCSGTNVPNATVLLFKGPIFESDVQAAVVADNSGGYTINAPPGPYGLAAIKNFYLVDTVTAPMVTLGGTTITTNVSLLPSAGAVSGTVVDAANSSRTVAGILMSARSDSGLMAISFTDTNGMFNVGVTAGQWYLGADDLGLVSRGYVGSQDRTNVTAGQTGITIAVRKATALLYGSVKDSSGNPLVGIDVYAYDNDQQYQTDGYSDANGNYCAGMLGGLSNDPWRLEISTDSGPANYVFTQASFQEAGGTNLAVGQAVRQDFVGMLATNQISGTLTDGSSQPITNIWIWAQTTNNGAVFRTGMDTDGTGHYTFNVGNGIWQVMVSCGGGNNSLGGQYLCPGSQTIIIANNDTNVYFTALLPTSQISGSVKDTSNNAITNVGVNAWPSNGGNGPSVLTDSNGNYSLAVANGSWNVNVFCCGNNSLGALGYLCVGQQSTNVFNSTNVVNFIVPRAPYQITGHLRDAGNNPIANVSVWANSDSYNACATTAGDGSFTLNVTNGDWYVSVDCNALGSFSPPYLCPNGQSVTVSNANVALDFSTAPASYQITGWVKNNSNQPFTNLDVHAYTTIGTNSYWLDSWTDSGGNYSFQVANGAWGVGVDCGGLGSGYLCPGDVPITIAGASVMTNFVIQACSPLQILTTSLPNGQAGVPYDFYFQASGCFPPFTWALVSGSTPPELSENPATGEIYGTPTNAGTYNFTIQVTDNSNATTNQPLSLTILPAQVDVAQYSVTKIQYFRQLDAANLVPNTNRGPFMAKLSIIQSGLGTVPFAEVVLPGGAGRALPLGSNGVEMVLREYYSSQAAFDADYTNGNYTFAMATVHNGLQFPVLAMPVAVYPAAQHVTNFAAAQAINPANPFTLQWSNPADATTNDVIWAFITDTNGNTVFTTPYPPMNRSTCLKGTATSVVVPASTLQAGATYTGVIGFYRGTSHNTTAYPGAVGSTSVGVMTDFPMATPSAPPPVLSQPTRVSSTQFGFLLSGAAGQSYTVLTSTNLALPLSNWFPVLSTNLPGSSAFIQDSQATNQRRFYRVKVGL